MQWKKYHSKLVTLALFEWGNLKEIRISSGGAVKLNKCVCWHNMERELVGGIINELGSLLFMSLPLWKLLGGVNTCKLRVEKYTGVRQNFPNLGNHNSKI